MVYLLLYVENKNDTMSDIVERLQDFMENEARSCSMDFGCVTPLYVYRLLGGAVSMKEIATAMDEIKKNQ